MTVKEDTHFLIDNAPPKEVEYVLRSLSPDVSYSVEELRSYMYSEWHFEAQKDLAYSPRRLFDLGLAAKRKTKAGKPGYVLTKFGQKVRDILSVDIELYPDILHYLHYDKYDGTPSARKLFWSYRCCCEIFWELKQIPPVAELVAKVQSRIAAEFPRAYSQRIGGNFNAGGVTSGWKPWVKCLVPLVLGNGSQELTPRSTRRFELVLLSLDYVYRARGYRYGDPIVLDDDLLDSIARVFFLDLGCCRELIGLAAKMTKAVALADTFAGTSVNLLVPYGIERI